MSNLQFSAAFESMAVGWTSVLDGCEKEIAVLMEVSFGGDRSSRRGESGTLLEIQMGDDGGEGDDTVGRYAEGFKGGVEAEATNFGGERSARGGDIVRRKGDNPIGTGELQSSFFGFGIEIVERD